MADVRLDSLQPGDQFEWSGVRFCVNRDTQDVTLSCDERPHRRVTYLQASGRGEYGPGDKGLMPRDTMVRACLPPEAEDSRKDKP
jgi:hypothetical protein